jgi:hypothetical protein
VHVQKARKSHQSAGCIGERAFSGRIFHWHVPGNGGVNVDYLAFTPLPPGPWNAQIQNDNMFGVQTNQFGFNVIGDNWTFVVEAAADLTNPVWVPVATNTITGGLSYFGDPNWTNYPGRFYHLRSL